MGLALFRPAAAEELLHSIEEISRQLQQTTGLVQATVAEAQKTNEMATTPA